MEFSRIVIDEEVTLASDVRKLRQSNVCKQKASELSEFFYTGAFELQF